jgi:hypothetical protein
MENYLVVLKAQAAMLPKLLRVEHRYQRCDRRTDHDRSQAANPFTTVTEQLCNAMIGIFVPARDGGIGGIQMLTIRRVSNDDRGERECAGASGVCRRVAHWRCLAGEIERD